MSTLAEIAELVETVRQAGGQELALLKCTSAYPAPLEAMNLRTIPHLAEGFGVPVGLSDHTLGIAAPVAAVALGACIVEKHFTLSRSLPGPDSAFSLEPDEFKAMADHIRAAEKALGNVDYALTAAEAKSRVFRRSLFVVAEVRAGELFTPRNVRSSTFLGRGAWKRNQPADSASRAAQKPRSPSARSAHPAHPPCRADRPRRHPLRRAAT
jgi:N-acetylneuraminate synthase